jgi:Na+-transporting methylmalonyl-CoA/oxaloacetate decarboxylase gamma subunit
MKKIRLAFLALVATSIITVSSVYASFPVKNEVKTEQTSNSSNTAASKNAELKTVQKVLDEQASAKPAKPQMDNEKLITILLWFFLGGLAAHRWYAGKPAGWNILFILTAGGCGVWAIIDLINILTDNF